jgi:glyceraldehyde 3-phosphate dehydrogenase
MGRLVVRALRHHPELVLTHINEVAGTIETAVHLLAFDSVHGRYDGEVTVSAGPGDAGDGKEVGDAGGLRGNRLVIDGSPVTYSDHDTPGAVPWDELGVDLVLECSGAFRTAAALGAYFDRGVRKVVVAAPVPVPDDDPDAVLNIVMGCNDDLYQPERHRLVTAASCTTNCLAPVVKVLHEQVGIERGVITTIHDVTNTQVVVAELAALVAATLERA